MSVEVRDSKLERTVILHFKNNNVKLIFFKIEKITIISYSKCSTVENHQK